MVHKWPRVKVTAVIAVFHQGALSTAPLKCTALWGSVWVWKRTFGCCRRTSWWTARGSPLPTALNEWAQKYCHGHHTWLVGAAVTNSSLSTMCHQKCCKYIFPTVPFFFPFYFSILASNSVQQRHSRQMCRPVPVSETCTTTVWSI